MRIALILTAIAWLTGCSHSPGVCPPLFPYDDAFRARLTEELRACPDCTATRQALADYIDTRRMIEVCREINR